MPLTNAQLQAAYRARQRNKLAALKTFAADARDSLAKSNTDLGKRLHQAAIDALVG